MAIDGLGLAPGPAGRLPALVTDSIVLTGIRALGTHGVLPEEHSRPQPFEVDIELAVDLSLPGRSDLLSDTVDYDMLTASVVKIIETGRYSLMEALATRIADACKADKRVASVAVTVRKLRPPVGLMVRHVGVRIER